MFLGLPDSHPDPLVSGTDPRIRIHFRILIKMSCILLVPYLRSSTVRKVLVFSTKLYLYFKGSDFLRRLDPDLNILAFSADRDSKTICFIFFLPRTAASPCVFDESCFTPSAFVVIFDLNTEE
jgi:hypothetical protein